MKRELPRPEQPVAEIALLRFIRLSLSGSHTGADTAATLFTIIESCKKNDLDPRTYLTSVLKCLTESDEIETPLQHAKRIRQYR